MFLSIFQRFFDGTTETVLLNDENWVDFLVGELFQLYFTR